MKKLFVSTLVGVLFSCYAGFGATHHVYDDFVITQSAPGPANTTVVDLLKTSPEIVYFETPGDIALFQFLEHDPFASYTTELHSGGINLTGGASDLLNISSLNSFHYTGDAPGTMILNSFNGTRNIFDPLFSSYLSLVCDIQNIGTNDIYIIPRVGPNSTHSNYAMYYGFDQDFNGVNIKTLAAGDTATLIFKLGGDPSVASSAVWDYAQDPSSLFELLFQPVSGNGFDVLVDNVGFVAVPEPGAFILFALGALIKLFWRKK